MTDERIGEIEQRLKKATPGPYAIEDDYIVTRAARDQRGNEIAWDIKCNRIAKITPEELGTYWVDCGFSLSAKDKENLELLSHAPTDIADLLAEVKKLRGAKNG